MNRVGLGHGKYACVLDQGKLSLIRKYFCFSATGNRAAGLGDESLFDTIILEFY